MSRLRPITATIDCPHCGTEYSGLPAEHDLDTRPCNDDSCTVKLCLCCPQFTCDGCGLKYCLEHRTKSGDLNLCVLCLLDSLEDLSEPECECVQIDVDLDDASGCPAHGSHSELARRQREREADDEAAWAERLAGFFDGDDEDEGYALSTDMPGVARWNP